MQLKVLFLISAVTAFPLSVSPNTVSIVPQNDQRLIKLGPNDYRIATEHQKLALKRGGINYIDYSNQISVEDALRKGLVRQHGFSWLQKLIHTKDEPVEIPIYNYPQEAKYQKEVREIYNDINIDLVRENLQTFSSFFTRYYKSPTGLESANWLYSQVTEIVEPVAEKVSVTKIHHVGWDQYTIVVSIPGETADKVILGAHQDSINAILPYDITAPGADDDGSGTVTILETLRLIIGVYAAKTFKPHNTLEFQFYSAEEGGLLGSIDLFTRYRHANESVLGMLQQDMTGSTAKTIEEGIEPHFGLITNQISPHLNGFLKTIINTYNSIPYHESPCAFGCSDHVSAHEKGYPSAFIIEAETKYSSRYIHTIYDTIDRIDFDHVKEHVKLSVAYAYELSNAKDVKK